MLFDEASHSRLPQHRAYISSTMAAPSFPNFSGSTGGDYLSPMRSSPSSSSSSSSVSRLHTTPSFVYNARIALALVPAAAFLLDLGGAPVAVVLTVGLMVSYILDSIRLKSAAFFAVWFSLIAAQLTFFASASSSLASSSSISSLPLTAMALLICAETNFLIGLWASLQFRWILIENPSIVASLERILFACIPIVTPALFTWAIISAIGMMNAAYYFLAFACVSYWLYSLPRSSSFRSKHDPATDSQILGSLESCIHTLYLIFAPVLFHAASHHSTTFSSFSSICDLLLLFFIPFAFQLYASTRGALWWISKNDFHIRKIQVTNGAVAVAFIVVCLEVRVVFHSFSRYVHAPPPFNYILVTMAMFGGASAVGAYALGMVNDSLSSAAFTALVVFASGAGAIVLGFSLMFIPLPLVCGFYLARFFTKKSLPSYFAFVTLASLMISWFVVHNFWDLNIWMAGMNLKSLCKLILVCAFLAMAIPGFVLFPPKLEFLAELGLIGYALLLCYVEDRFFNYSIIYYFGFEDDVIYPSYMVLLTTILGLGLVRRLALDHRIGPKVQWILTCLFASKLAMLFISSKSVVWASAALLLAVSPPILLYRDRLKGASKMKIWQGYSHACVVAISAWFCRETIFEALQWWNGMPPSDGLLLGSYVLLTGIACIPIVAFHFSHTQPAKRYLLLVVAMGLMLTFLQPPIPLSWAFRSDLIKAARHSTDDFSIYGLAVSRPTWPSWLLITTILLALAAFTNIIPIKFIVELRAFYAVGVGTTLGIYVCAEYFVLAAILHPLLVAAVVCASVFVVFTHFPSASSTRILPWVFALMVALLPVSYLLEGQIRAKSSGEDDEANKFSTLLAIEGARMSLLGLYAMLFMLISLVIKFELASLLREKANERGVAKFQPKLRAPAGPAFTIRRLAAEASWMPAVGNTSTLLCFSICLIISASLTGGSVRAIFFLAPILLLLNQDSDIFAGFGDRQRYFPVILAVSLFLVLNAIYRIWEEVRHGNTGWGLEIGGPGWFFAVKNAALLILSLPNHILFNRFMWDYAKQTDSILLLTMPLNIPSVIITDITTVRVLGLLGIIYSLVQYLISRKIRMAGMKYI